MIDGAPMVKNPAMLHSSGIGTPLDLRLLFAVSEAVVCAVIPTEA